MKTEKSVYSAPTAKCFEVKVQGVFCQSLRYGDPGAAGGDIEDGNTYNL